jgi:hypothetical protein
MYIISIGGFVSKVTNEINKLDVFLTSFVRLIYDNNVLTTHNSGFSYRFKTMAVKFLCTLYPLEDLSLKCLTFKLIALIALTTAARAQSLSATDEINKLDVFLTSFVRLIYDNNVFTTHNSGFSYRFKTMAGKLTPGLDVFNSF